MYHYNVFSIRVMVEMIEKLMKNDGDGKKRLVSFKPKPEC
jgi:hypothetical protein